MVRQLKRGRSTVLGGNTEIIEETAGSRGSPDLKGVSGGVCLGNNGVHEGDSGRI